MLNQKKIEMIMNCLCMYDHSMRLKLKYDHQLISIKLFGKTWAVPWITFVWYVALKQHTFKANAYENQ